MNLWVRKTGLVLLAALSFFACEEEISTIGLPPENDLGIFFVDVPLNDRVSQVWVDNINSRNTGNILVGSYQDEYFGLIRAQNFSELTLPSLNPGSGFHESATLDSMVLETRIRGLYGSDVSAVPQVVEIHQMSDTIPVKDLTYTTASTQSVAQKLSESEFFVYPDSVGLTFKDTGRKLENGADSAYKEKFFDANDFYIYRSTFKINEDFAQDIFTKVKNEDPIFGDVKDFAGFIKGISFVPGATNSAIITYGATDTRLVIYYSETDSTNTQVQKTLSFTANSALSYNNIQPNEENGWSGSDFDDLTSFYEPYFSNSGLAYVQSGTNLYMKIDLSLLDQFVDTVKNPVIQKAELVFENIKGVSKTTPTPSSMVYYLTSNDSLANENYRVSFLRDISGQTLLANYDDDDNIIKNDLALSLQGIILQPDFNQLIMAPVNTSGTPDARNINRLVVPKDDIHLRFYYTVPDKNN